ncbi:MAG: Hpt domain-containing protein [Alphaproteobacteria bacterium]|nr:Hpt domain-containing protein [Alphaproteobacteria bacterium]MBU0798478.1 Hpt domain-containing protein [Alphaproteobacteria bacterium]MBU0886723.1 Hpt domain-containing protein [Alphaproteobacteria bacterium]MBU1812549.1 Hpt domain-containing protein [Alphaproteobacteria bacterium]
MAKHEVIQPRNKLREMLGGAKGLDAGAMAKAETAALRMQERTDFTAQAQTSLRRLQAAYARTQHGADSALIGEIFEIAHDMRGEGGSFGFPLVTQIGDILCKYLNKLARPEDIDITVLKLHIDALQAVINQKLKGEGDDIARQVVQGLSTLALGR